MKITIRRPDRTTEEYQVEDGVFFFMPKGPGQVMKNIPLAEVSAIYNNSKKRVSSVSLEPEERVLAI